MEFDTARIHGRLEAALQETEPDFGSFFLLRFLGLEVTYGDESCTVSVPTTPEMFNPQGTSYHGGALAIAIDISMGHLCNRFLSRCVTVDMSVKFLRPVVGPVRCTATFLKKARSIVTVESRVLDDDDRLCAFATGTWYRLPQEPPES